MKGCEPLLTNNPPIKRCSNKIAFKTKNRYYLGLLTPQRTKLLGSNENKVTKNRNGENAPHLKIDEVILVQCNIVKNDYQEDGNSCVCICSK